MSELSRQPDPELTMVHDPDQPQASSPSQILTPEAIKRDLATGYLQRVVPTLYHIRQARDDERLTQSQAEDYLTQLQTIVRHELGTDILERYPDPDELKKLFGRDYFGPETVSQTWGVEVRPEQLPIMPFSWEELQRAHKIGQMLRLRISQAPDGFPLTIEKMIELRRPALIAADRMLLSDQSWYQDEPFYTSETPTPTWVLTTPDILPGSTNRNYLEQIGVLIDYMENKVFQGQVPLLHRRAIRAFHDYVAIRFGDRTFAEIQVLLKGPDWLIYASELTNLDITNNYRASAAETVYDLELDREMTGKYLMGDSFTWTRSRVNAGLLVDLGKFGPKGMSMSRWVLGAVFPDLGLVFSRKQ